MRPRGYCGETSVYSLFPTFWETKTYLMRLPVCLSVSVPVRPPMLHINLHPFIIFQTYDINLSVYLFRLIFRFLTGPYRIRKTFDITFWSVSVFGCVYPQVCPFDFMLLSISVFPCFLPLLLGPCNIKDAFDIILISTHPAVSVLMSVPLQLFRLMSSSYCLYPCYLIVFVFLKVRVVSKRLTRSHRPLYSQW